MTMTRRMTDVSTTKSNPSKTTASLIQDQLMDSRRRASGNYGYLILDDTF